MTSADVREKLIAALRLDLVGPEPGSAHARERLPLQPSRWYLTGFLVPYEGGEEQRSDFTAQDELDLAGDDDAHGDDAAVPEQASQRKAFLPSSLGVSVLVPEHATSLTIAVDWADYVRERGDDDEEADVAAPPRVWQREPRHESVVVTLPAETERPLPADVPHSGGLQLVLSVRPVHRHDETGVPPGTRSVAVFLVNHREPAPDGVRDQAFAFQAEV